MKGIMYDAVTAASILGIRCEFSDPLPEPRDGKSVIYYPGATLTKLRDTTVGREWLANKDRRYDTYAGKAAPGYYELLLRDGKTNRMTWNEQLSRLASLDSSWQPAPTPIVMTTLLLHLAVTGEDLLKGNYCRCAEEVGSGRHLSLGFFWGRLILVYEPDDAAAASLWLAACRQR
jgi:hypothetical protein